LEDKINKNKFAKNDLSLQTAEIFERETLDFLGGFELRNHLAYVGWIRARLALTTRGTECRDLEILGFEKYRLQELQQLVNKQDSVGTLTSILILV